MRLIRRATPVLATALVLGCTGVPSVTPTGAPSGAGAPSPSPVPSAAPSAAQASYQLTGTVYDDNLSPVAGASVTAEASGTPAVKGLTGADGRYTLALAGGAYTVTAAKAGWTTRSQALSVAKSATLDFGSVAADPVNPFYLSDTPEVSRVDVHEDAPAGPLTLVVHLSEPLTVSSQENFVNRLQLLSGTSSPFLEIGAPYGTLTTQQSWDAAGQTLTVHFAGPYVPSGQTPQTYTLRLRQSALDTKDPVTQETQWEDMGIADAAGNAIGEGRATDAFLDPTLAPFPLALVANKSWGYYAEEARWNLTHSGGYTFTAAKDTLHPAPVSLTVATQGETQDSGPSGSGDDVMTLHFNEPMWAAKDAANPQYNRLDVTKDLLAEIDGSKNPDGSGAQPLVGVKPTRVQFSLDDPTIVQLHFTLGSFVNVRWVKVKLGPDMLDPAGNAPDPSNATASGAAG